MGTTVTHTRTGHVIFVYSLVTLYTLTTLQQISLPSKSIRIQHILIPGSGCGSADFETFIIKSKILSENGKTMVSQNILKYKSYQT